jgi:hypothetical protein
MNPVRFLEPLTSATDVLAIIDDVVRAGTAKVVSDKTGENLVYVSVAWTDDRGNNNRTSRLFTFAERGILWAYDAREEAAAFRVAMALR